jgi:hypothetical protein
MVPWLPRFVLALVLLAAAPAAYAQYIYLDSNRDGVCNGGDLITTATDSVDVWLDTAHNLDGSLAVCSTGEPLSIDAYEIIVHGSDMTFLGYTNKRPEFTVATPLLVGGTDATVGYAAEFANTNNLPPGRYVLGTMAVQRANQNCPALFLVSSTAARPSAVTGFRSECQGNAADQWIKLGDDFFDVCAAASICDGVESTTWGHIKVMYR